MERNIWLLQYNTFKIAILYIIVVLMAGCASIKPQPLTSKDILTQSQKDRIAAQAGTEPLDKILTLEEAIARALKYNLDGRTHQMEEALALRTFDASKYEMLPKATVSAGYHERNNDLITNSRDSVTGEPSLSNPYISSERASTTSEVNFSWSLLDFGLSYLNAKQNANKFLSAKESRRKAANILIRDVQNAFWRTASAQKLHNTVIKTIAEGEQALADSRQIEKENLQPPLDSLRYQRQVLENLRLLESINQELSTASIDLAALINAPIGSKIKLKEPKESLNLAIVNMPIERLEQQAIEHNHDLREQFYNGRIARDETKKIMVRMFPGLSFNYALKRSNDSFLINQNWQETGVQLAFNLVGLLSMPSQKKMADAGVALADQKRIATQMAVLTQLHLARLQYINSAHLFRRADALWKVDNNIALHAANEELVEKTGRLQRIANQTTAILSELRRYQAMAQAQAAANNLQVTLGIDPDLNDIQNMPLSEVTSIISSSLSAWRNGTSISVSK